MQINRFHPIQWFLKKLKVKNHLKFFEKSLFKLSIFPQRFITRFNDFTSWLKYQLIVNRLFSDLARIGTMLVLPPHNRYFNLRVSINVLMDTSDSLRTLTSPQICSYSQFIEWVRHLPPSHRYIVIHFGWVKNGIYEKQWCLRESGSVFETCRVRVCASRGPHITTSLGFQRIPQIRFAH